MTREWAGLVFAVFCASLLVPSIVQRIRRNRRRRAMRAAVLQDLRAALTKAGEQRDIYCDLWHQALRANAALKEHIGDEREAAAVQALVEAPAYFDALAAREASRIDAEWFELSEEGL